MSRSRGKDLTQAEIETRLELAHNLEKFYEEKARRENEEDDEHVQELLAEGALSETQVKGMAARRKMKEKEQFEEHQFEGAAAAAGYATTEQMIQEHLDDNWAAKNGVLRILSDVFGLHTLHAKINLALRERRHPDWKHPWPLTDRVVRSGPFEAFVGVLIMANGLTIGWSISLDDRAPDYLEMLEHLFTAVFCLEVVLRLASSGWTWIFMGANFLEVLLIVVTGIVPLWILRPAGFESPIVRAMQLLRVLRLVRLVRMVRTYQAFRVLWELIQGVTETRLTLMWIWVTLGFVMFVFSVFSVQLIYRSSTFEGDPVAEEYFGDVPKALVTLLQVVTLDSWSFVARPLMKKSGWVGLGFVAAIMVLVMALLNLIVAVIVNNFFARKEQDGELKAADQITKKERAVTQLRHLLMMMDEDGSGMISFEEYASAVKTNAELRDMLSAELGVDPGEELGVWDDVMPRNRHGEISIAEFTHSLRMMSGEAKARESFRITRLAAKQNERLKRLQWRIRHSAESARKLRMECEGVQEEVCMLLHGCGEFIKYAGRCTPGKAALFSEGDLAERVGQLHDRCVTSTSLEALRRYKER